MSATGLTLLLDLHECKSPALGNPSLLEELFIGALQFAGLESVDHFSRNLANQGTMQIYQLPRGHAVLYVWQPNFVSIDLYTIGETAVLRPALELIRGYLTQKLIARSANAQLIERGK
jgi:S-adenosylmethionine/arginine decarboxylase-like enzyme